MQVQVRGQCILKIAGNVRTGSVAKDFSRTDTQGFCEGGFKGFNQHAVSIIIAETDPRKQSQTLSY